MAHNHCIVDSGHGILCSLVLVAAALAWLPHRPSAHPTVAMDCCPTLGARVRGGPKVRLGLWTHRSRNARAPYSAEEAGGGWLLQVRAQSDVRWLLRRMDRAVGGSRSREFAADRRSGCCSGRSGSLCAVV